MIKANLYSIDIKILEKAIATYQQQTNEDPNYIIMNANTERIIQTECGLTAYTTIESYKDSNIKYCTFWGIPVAFCNRLNDGEIELI